MIDKETKRVAVILLGTGIVCLALSFCSGCAPQTYGTNLPGEQGPTGNSGPVGPAGNAGPVGPSGVAGVGGSAGANGQDGTGFTPGLKCDIYSVLTSDENSPVNWFQMLTNGSEKFSVVLPNFNVPNQNYQTVWPGFTSAQQALIGYTNYGFDCSGYLDIPADGDYSFNLSSDDGSELALDNTVLINMPQVQAMNSGTANNVPLYSGYHRFNLLYFQGPAVMLGLVLQWQGPSNVGLGTMGVVPPSYFSH